MDADALGLARLTPPEEARWPAHHAAWLDAKCVRLERLLSMRAPAVIVDRELHQAAARLRWLIATG